MSERLNRTSICTVIFINIVDYVQATVDDQIALKERFNALINEAVKDVAQNDRIILDTGDGAALALLGAPEEALFVALDIRERVMASLPSFAVRIGINLGPVRVVNDLNGMLNVVGDGINAAQRVMSFAQPNLILVSRSYYEIASRLSSEIAAMFAYYGVKTDKYVREHEIYIVLDGQSVAPAVPAETALRGSRTTALALCRNYWIPASAGLMLLAIVWGVWISLAAQESTAGDVFAEIRKERGTGADKPAKTASSDEAAAVKKTRAKETKTVSHRVRHESDRSSLCSDAQRMLKQC
jgi:hypothetical protein